MQSISHCHPYIKLYIISALNHIPYTGLDLYAPTHYIQFQAWQGCMDVCEVQLIMSVFETVHIHHVHA